MNKIGRCLWIASLLLSTGLRAEILVGQTVGITGTVAAAVAEADIGARLVFDAVNAKGGVNGEQIQLLRMDDAFDVARTMENARALVEDKKVVALFMTRGTPNTEAIIPLLDKHKVPLIAPNTGAMVLRRPVQKHVFNVRAAYQQEVEKAIRYLTTIRMTRIAVIHADDSFGHDVLEGATRAFEAAKMQPALVLAVDRNMPDHASVIPRIVSVNAQAVIWVSSGTGVVDSIKALRAAHSTAQVLTLSSNASIGFIERLGAAGQGVVVTQVFPGDESLGVPMIREAMAAANARGLAHLSPVAIEGYASAKVLVEALRRAGPKLTRASLVAALNGMDSYDLGGLEVRYSPQDHNGLEYTDISIIRGGSFKR